MNLTTAELFACFQIHPEVKWTAQRKNFVQLLQDTCARKINTMSIHSPRMWHSPETFIDDLDDFRFTDSRAGRELEKRSKIDDYICWFAAQNNAVLASRNTRDSRHFAKLQLMTGEIADLMTVSEKGDQRVLIFWLFCAILARFTCTLHFYKTNRAQEFRSPYISKLTSIYYYCIFFFLLQTFASYEIIDIIIAIFEITLPEVHK